MDLKFPRVYWNWSFRERVSSISRRAKDQRATFIEITQVSELQVGKSGFITAQLSLPVNVERKAQIERG
jgi:hypothetical protein